MKKVHNQKQITISESEYLEFLKLKEENSAVKEQNLELAQTIEQLMEQIRLARQKRFGKSSEQSTDELLGQLSFLFTPQGALSFAKAKFTLIQQKFMNQKLMRFKKILQTKSPLPLKLKEHKENQAQ